MPATLDELESAALQLDPSARGELIRRLLRTLEPESIDVTEEEWLDYWLAEAERRCEELESGVVTPIDGPTAMKQWKERYQ